MLPARACYAIVGHTRPVQCKVEQGSLNKSQRLPVRRLIFIRIVSSGSTEHLQQQG